MQDAWLFVSVIIVLQQLLSLLLSFFVIFPPYHMRVCVHSYFFEVHRTFSREGSCEKITYTHVLSRGKTQEQHYGQL